MPHLSSDSRIEIHIKDACVWSQRVEFFGFAVGRGIDSTVPLEFGVPRKFRKLRSRKKPIPESLLLRPDVHYIVLGDPGAGKTTTIKRLIAEFLSTPAASADDLNMPLFFRLGELSADAGLLEAFANLLAIDVRRDPPLPAAGEFSQSAIDAVEGSREIPRYRLLTLEGVPVEAAIAHSLDELGALIFLDGLDETSAFIRSNVEAQIVALTRQLRRSRILLTCRSGDYTRPLEGFDSLEIVPLDRPQIKSIAHKWSANPGAFLTALSKAPFSDLASRPLFLCQLIVLFENVGFLPGRTSEAYERILRLSLTDWDHYKRVKRHSRYATFDVERKLDFLSSLAFFFTYTKPGSTFDTKMLAQAYAATHEQFALPAGEAALVARELESHTGILLEAAYARFEFCHRSLQEFLCGRYLVKGILTYELARYLTTDPAPVAVAASLASEPGKWLGMVIMDPRVREILTSDIATRLVSRFMLEQPALTLSDELAFAALHLWMLARSGDSFRTFFMHDIVRKSLQQLLLAYDATILPDDRVKLLPRLKWLHRENFPVTNALIVSHQELDELLNIAQLRLCPARSAKGTPAVWHISPREPLASS